MEAAVERGQRAAQEAVLSMIYVKISVFYEKCENSGDSPGLGSRGSQL